VDEESALRDAVAGTTPGERLALVDARFTGHRHSLRLGLTDPRFPAAAVPGALTVQPPARAALLAALTGVPVSAGRGRTDHGALPDRLGVRLEEAGTAVHRPELGSLVAAVPATGTDREAALAAVAAVDEEQVRLRSVVKTRDGFFTTFCVSPYSRYVARWCARRGLTPNQVTTASLFTALIAAGCAATGTRAGFVAAGVLLLCSFVLDCADGQLARYALRYSTLGAWLDATFDRAKEYAFYAGLALGAARGGDDVWALALGAMVLQTGRHIVDFAYSETDRRPGAPSSRAAALSGRLDSVGWTVWLRRIIVLPIGERWAMLAVLAALTTPRITFAVVLVAGGFAACYTTAGRVLRSFRAGPGALPPGDAAEQATALAALTDSGPLAESAARSGAGHGRGRFTAPLWALAGTGVLLAAVSLLPVGSWTAVAAAAWYALCAGRAITAPLTRPLDWLLPPLFRIAEYSTLLILAARSEVNGALPAAFGLVAICAYHHYDTVYRLRGGAGAPRRLLVLLAGGHEGRTLLVVIAAALWADGGAFPLALAVLAGALAFLVLTESLRFWISSQAPAVHDETGEPT
jgi:phosphatidylglycerophosphate synthase